jgi:hypothetical protein
MMRAAAGFHANQLGLQLRKERQKLRPPQGLVEHHFFTGGQPVDLENVLGQINSNCGNSHGVAPLISGF